MTRRVAIGAVLAAMAIVVVDMAMVNVALPTLSLALGATAAQTVWVVIAHQTALIMALLPWAALGDRLGHRRVFTWGIALFTAASALCAGSPSLPWLVAACFLQGLGSAAVMALGIALLRFTLPPDQLGSAIGWNALVVALASAAGPTLGAAILSAATWRWLFVLPLVPGVLVLAAARALPDRTGTPGSLDRIAVALNAASLSALVLGAAWASSAPASGAAVASIGAVGLVVLVRRESASEAPVIPLDLLRERSFRIAVIASILCFAGQTAGLLALPFHLRYALGFDTLSTGLVLTPWPLAVAFTAPLAGRLAQCGSPGRLCAAGGACLATGLGMLALERAGARTLEIVPLTLLCGVGFGLFNVPNNRNLFLAAPLARSGAAGGMQGTARVLGQVAGALLMRLLFERTSIETAPRSVLLLAAGSTLLAGLVSTASRRTTRTEQTADPAPDLVRSSEFPSSARFAESPARFIAGASHWKTTRRGR